MEHTFELSNSGKEFPARFGGQKVTYTAPEAVLGGETVQQVRAKLGATPFDRSLDAILSVCDPTADAGAVLVAKFNGQGYHLDYQKAVKAALGQEKDKKNVHADLSVEAAMAVVETRMKEFKIGAPPEKKEKGAKNKERAEKAEARAAAKDSGARMLYIGLSPAQRKQFRPQLIAQGTFTAEELDGIDAEIKAGATK